MRPGPTTGRRAPSRPAWVSDALFPFDSRFLDLDGHRIHHLDEGKGPPLLFLPAGPGWSFTYRTYVARLRERFRCVALDFPGFGLSEAAEGFAPTAPALADVLEAFGARLGLDGAVVWANDSSGLVAAAYAGRRPERVAGLVLGGTFGWSLESHPAVERMLGVVTSGPVRWVHRRTNFLARTMGGPALGTRVLTPLERAHYTRPFDGAGRRDNLMTLFRSLRDDRAFARDVEARLALLREKPALLVFGEEDRAVREGFLDRWKRELPRHRAVLLPRVKHFPFEDAPEAVLAAFEAWWPTTTATTSPAASPR